MESSLSRGNEWSSRKGKRDFRNRKSADFRSRSAKEGIMDILNTKNATILGRKMNVRKLLERKVRQHGDKPFIIFVDKDLNEEILTYRQFDETVNRLANWLLEKGIRKGDFVLVHLPNSTGFAVALHACTKIGAVMIPSIIFDVAEDLEYKLNFSEAKMVITDGYYYPIFESIRAKCPSIKDIVI